MPGAAEGQRVAIALREDERPTLVLWADSDPALPFSVGEQVSEALGYPAPRKIENAGHFLQEDAGEEIGAIIAEWLGASWASARERSLSRSHAARRPLVLEPGDRSRPVGARRRAGVVEGGGEDPAAGVVEAAAAGQRPLAIARFGAGAVGVAGDHVRGVEPERGGHLGRGVDAAAGDRRRGEVGLEVGAQQPVEGPDGGRDAAGDGGAQRGAANPVAGAVAAGDPAPGALGGAGRAPRQARLREAVGEPVDRAQDALVVGGGGRSGTGPKARITAAAATHSIRGRLMWQSM